MTNPAHGNTPDAGRGIDNLDPIDNLLGDDPDEAMQTGYSPPDREPHSLRDAPTRDEEREGRSLDEALAEERADTDDEDIVAGPEDARAGRLISPEDSATGAHSAEPDGVGVDVGPAGYASSAEEAAVHIHNDHAAER